MLHTWVMISCYLSRMGRNSRGKRKSFNEGLHKTQRSSTSKELPICVISYAKAHTLLNEPHVKEMIETRHVTLGWQHASNIGAVIRDDVLKSVGRYVESLHAIPIAIGTIEIERSIYIVEDHDCMHLDLRIHMIAFDCKEKCDRPLKCKAVLNSDKTIIGQLYGIITVVNSTPIPQIKKGDEFHATFVGIQFDHNLCQLRTKTYETLKTKRLKKDMLC